MVRYETVTDYSAYVQAFWDIRGGIYDGWFEYGFQLLNKPFAFSEWGFIPLIMLCTLIPYAGIYSCFRKYDIVLWGTLVFVLSGYITRYDNIIRQGISMGLFFYAMRFALQKNFAKYILYCGFAIIFHYSAIVLIPFYFLIRFASSFKPPVILSFLLVVTFFMLYMIGVFEALSNFVFDIFPFYKNYINKSEFGAATIGVSALFKSLLAWVPTLLISRKDSADVRMIVNMSWFAALGYLLVRNFIVLDRVVEYLYIFQVIAIAIFFKRLTYKFKLNKMILCYGLVLMLFVTHIRFVINYYGNNIYYTVFSNKCLDHKFYDRRQKKDLESTFDWAEIRKYEVINP